MSLLGEKKEVGMDVAQLINEFKGVGPITLTRNAYSQWVHWPTQLVFKIPSRRVAYPGAKIKFVDGRGFVIAKSCDFGALKVLSEEDVEVCKYFHFPIAPGACATM